MIKKNDDLYDVIVIGAGPAGVSAALFTAREGYRVLIIDKEKFPREKVCGDGLSIAALSILEEMDVLDAVEKNSNAWKIDGFTLSSPDYTILKSRYPLLKGLKNYGIVFPRKEFDHLMVEHIKKFDNIDFLENCTFTDYLYEDNRISGITCTYKKREYTFPGRYIIGADGIHSPAAKKLSLSNKTPGHRAFSVRAYFDNVDNIGSSIEIHYDKSLLPGYGWIFPTGKKSANAGVIVYNRYTSSRDIRSLFNNFITTHKIAKTRLANARMVKNSFKGWHLNLGSFSGKKGKDNVLITGDSGSFIDTVTGEGIYQAMRTGQYAARAIISGLIDTGQQKNVLAIYEKLWKKEFKWNEYIPGYILQSLFKSPSLVNFSIARASRDTFRAMKLAGIIGHGIPKKKIFLSI